MNGFMGEATIYVQLRVLLCRAWTSKAWTGRNLKAKKKGKTSTNLSLCALFL